MIHSPLRIHFVFSIHYVTDSTISLSQLYNKSHIAEDSPREKHNYVHVYNTWLSGELLYLNCTLIHPVFTLCCKQDLLALFCCLPYIFVIWSWCAAHNPRNSIYWRNSSFPVLPRRDTHSFRVVALRFALLAKHNAKSELAAWWSRFLGLWCPLFMFHNFCVSPNLPG